MAVGSYNMTWEQGEDKDLNIVYKEGDPPVVVNLTGYKVRMDVRAGTTLVYTFNSDDIVEVPSVDTTGTADNEITILGVQGEIDIVIPRAATLSGGALFAHVGTTTLTYDVFLRNTLNKQKKILKGTININTSQTRWS